MPRIPAWDMESHFPGDLESPVTIYIGRPRQEALLTAALRCSSSIETVTQIIEVRLESDCLQASNVDFTSLHGPRNGSLKPMLICAGIFAFVISKFAKAASVHLSGFDLGGGGLFKITSLALCCENVPFLGSMRQLLSALSSIAITWWVEKNFTIIPSFHSETSRLSSTSGLLSTLRLWYLERLLNR